MPKTHKSIVRLQEYPRNHPKQALKTFINLSEALLSARKYPANVKEVLLPNEEKLQSCTTQQLQQIWEHNHTKKIKFQIQIR